jgi:HAMP domain-containing protein
MTQTPEQMAEVWLRENDWDYQKYGDRRPDRSAYDTLMNYEISDLLTWAFEAGYRARDAEVERLANAFGEFRQQIRGLLRYVGVPSNPGWTEQDILDALSKALRGDGGRG